MSSRDWTRQEVETIVDDYLAMLTAELAGAGYSKAAHRRALLPRLDGRSAPSIEFKHCNISAALLNAGMPSIAGYKARWNYQALIDEVLADRLAHHPQLHLMAAADADRPMVAPEVPDILSVLTCAPQPGREPTRTGESTQPWVRLSTNYIEREAQNRSLGDAGEQFVLQYERARLIHAGQERLAERIEHSAKVRGDHLGYDILSFEANGAERLIEVKTTKYSAETPFFVTRNELTTSERQAPLYHLYRLYAFRQTPKLYVLSGAISHSCQLSAATYSALPR